MSLDLARWQFAFTSVNHFLFIPITIGLAFLTALLQTAWHRSGREEYLRLTRFFGTLLVINVAIPAYSLTVHNTASAPYSLKAMTVVVVVIFLPLVLAYQTWTYYVFRRRVSREQFMQGTPPAVPPAPVPAQQGPSGAAAGAQAPGLARKRGARHGKRS
jgi:cytochrome bd-type quinol oxidase subunit 2